MLHWLLLGAGMSLAAWQDVKRHKIPNVLSLSMAFGGLLLGVSEGAAGVKTSLAGLLTGFAVGFLLWLIGVIRAGDAKLMSAIGAVIGWKGFLDCLLWGLVTGAVFGLLILLKKRKLRERMARLRTYFVGMILFHTPQAYEPEKGSEGELPFALPLLIGCFLAYCFPIFAI